MTAPKSSSYARRTVVALAVMVLLLPLAVWGALRAMDGMDDDAVRWTASDLDARKNLDWFVDQFGTRDSMLVSWPGCTLADPRLDRFAEALERGVPSAGGEAGPALFERVVTGRRVFAELTSPPQSFSPAEALQRLEGTLVGPDGWSSCAVVVLSPEASQEPGLVLQTIRDAGLTACGLAPDEIRMTGHAVEADALDRASLATMIWLSIPSALLVFLVAWPCFGSLRVTLIVALTAGFCQCLSFALVYYSGGQMSGMLAVTPILVLVIFISGAVHLGKYYRDAVTEVGVNRAPARALAMGWFPCVLAVVTSAIGVGSLWLSRVGPVSDFGMYTAAGMMGALAALLVVVPGALALASGAKRSGPPARSATGPSFWEPFAHRVARWHTGLVALCVAATVVGVFGLARVRSSMQLTDFFPGQSSIVRDHRWMEHQVGPLMPVEVVLRMDRHAPHTMLEKVELVRRVERAVRAMDPAARTVSLATYLPETESDGGFRSTMRRTLLARHLEADRDRLAAESPYLTRSERDELWRITVRLETFTGRPYEAVLADLRRAVDEALVDPGSGPAAVSPVYAGMLALVAESHPALLSDLITSFSVSLAMIAVVLMLGLRSVRLGLLSIPPNVFPIVVVFGFMGWMGHTIDVGSMMTAGVGLGIAVDDTVHFLTWFVRGMRDGMSRREAILHAYRRSASAMLRTTVICGAGLAIYGFSSFAPAARFGILVCVLLMAALVGDLVFLPALLSGWVGRTLFPQPRVAEEHLPQPGEEELPAEERRSA